MIKLEICKCIRPYNEFFEEGKLYILHPSKGSKEVTAYIDKNRSFRIVSERFVTAKISYHKMYFEAIGEINLKNYKEVNQLKNKSIEEIMEIIREKEELIN